MPGQHAWNLISVRAPTGGAVFGRVPGNHLLYYPLVTALGAVSAAMIVFPMLALFRGDELFVKLSAYSAAVLLLLAFTTVAAAWLIGPS